MSESSTISTPQVGTVVADGMVYVTTRTPCHRPRTTSHLITEDDTPVENLLSENIIGC